MVKSDLTRHGRRRRIWLQGQLRVLKQRTLALRASSAGRVVASSTGDATGSCTSYMGFRCSDVDALVDFRAMWSRLEQLVATQNLSTKLDTALLTRAVPILVRQDFGIAVPDVCLESVLLGQQVEHTDGTHADFALSEHVEIREGQWGRGVFALKDLPFGVTFLVEKPAVAVLDVESRRVNPWADLPSADTAALAQKLAAELAGPRGKRLIRLLAPFHPQLCPEAPTLQEEDSDAEMDADLAAEMRAEVAKAFSAVPDGEDIKARMEAVARLNGLGYYTSNEQVCHNETYHALTGTSLCLLASAINHSCSPNVTRYSIGGVLIFRTTAPVSTGQELFISYIESETLCEHRNLRRQSLNRDFTCMCSKCAAEDGKNGAPPKAAEDARYLSVDAQLQAELATMPAEQRAEICRSLLRGEMPQQPGDEEQEEEEEENSGKLSLLLKDAQEIRTVLALALMKIGNFREAWEVWLQASQLSAVSCPTFDEVLCVYVVQAALCAAATPSEAAAWRLLRVAAMMHHVAFGGEIKEDPCGVGFFLQRYAREFDLTVELSAGREAQSKQRALLARLGAERKTLARPSSWSQVRDEILGWKVPLQNPPTEKRKGNRADAGKVAPLAKPKTTVVNGLRILP